MNDHDAANKATADPVNDQVIARVTCIKCDRENVSMRWDWSLWRHNGPDGKPCKGDAEAQMMLEMFSFDFPAYQIREERAEPVPYRPSRYSYQEARALVSPSALRVYVALILYDFAHYTYDEYFTLTGIPKGVFIQGLNELLAAGIVRGMP